MIPTTDRQGIFFSDHATLASITLPAPGAGFAWRLDLVIAESDAASKVVTVKMGATSIATLDIGNEQVIPALEGLVCQEPILTTSTTPSANVATVISVSSTAASKLTVVASKIAQPLIVKAADFNGATIA